ncbi:hypothetical protein [Streptomyces caniscabiei]|uniref:hypothetical protein n=1 Tax=Streptomyces caniscabiei TaxID=2746961 RepID=UPI000A38A8AD|nr:hypothetical protein [Streptomyces caniscabiei]
MDPVLIRTLDGREAAGMRLLLAVIEHVDSTDSLRGPWASEGDERRLMDGRGDVWFVAADFGSVERVSFLLCPCGCAEVTTYADGAEVGRVVGRTA